MGNNYSNTISGCISSKIDEELGVIVSKNFCRNYLLFGQMKHQCTFTGPVPTLACLKESIEWLNHGG